MKNKLAEMEPIICARVQADSSTSPREKMIIHDAIKQIKPKVIVETGTHHGLTTCYMLCAVHDNGFGHIHTADPYDYDAVKTFNDFSELAQNCTYYKKKGKDLNIKNIDFLFIDGYHEKEEVLAEIDALFPLLRPGATVYFHDTNNRLPTCDVPGAIEECGLEVTYLETENGMAVYKHKI